MGEEKERVTTRCVKEALSVEFFLCLFVSLWCSIAVLATCHSQAWRLQGTQMSEPSISLYLLASHFGSYFGLLHPSLTPLPQYPQVTSPHSHI